MTKKQKQSRRTHRYIAKVAKEARALGELVPVAPSGKGVDGSPVVGPGQAYVMKYGTKYHPNWCEVVGAAWDRKPKGLLVIALTTVGGRQECQICRGMI